MIELYFWGKVLVTYYYKNNLSMVVLSTMSKVTSMLL